jgi:hypothetical protein
MFLVILDFLFLPSWIDATFGSMCWMEALFVKR